MNAYAERDRVLSEMGYASYRDYLDSDLWQQIRTKVMRAAKGLCRYCGKRAHEVHHSSYAVSVLRGDNLACLHAVCVTCHDNAERDGEGRKRRLDEANRILGIGAKATQPKAKPGKAKKKLAAGFCTRCKSMYRKNGWCAQCNIQYPPRVPEPDKPTKPGHCAVCGNQLTKTGDCRPCAKKQSRQQRRKQVREQGTKYRFPNPPGDFNLSREMRRRRNQRIDPIGPYGQTPAQVAAEAAHLPTTDNRGPCVLPRETGSQSSGAVGLLDRSIKQVRFRKHSGR